MPGSVIVPAGIVYGPQRTVVVAADATGVQASKAVISANRIRTCRFTTPPFERAPGPDARTLPCSRITHDVARQSSAHYRVQSAANRTRRSRLDSARGLKRAARALDELLEAHRRPVPVPHADHLARAIPERVQGPDRHRDRRARSERAPLALHHHVEAPLQDLVLLQLLRMDVGRRRYASRWQHELHLDRLAVRLGGWAPHDVDAAVGHREAFTCRGHRGASEVV